MLLEGLGAAAAIGGLLYWFRKREGGSLTALPSISSVLPGAEPAAKKLTPRYAPGTEEPGAIGYPWSDYGGARPEARGAPRNTILNVKGLAKQTPEFRARLLDLAEETGLPVDSIAAIMSSESGLNPQAVYKKDGKPFAVGLFQLTAGARLPGYSTPEELGAVLGWNAEEQLERIARPYFARFGKATDVTPGKMYMLNFLPEHASKPDDYVLGRRDDRYPVGHEKAGKLTWLGLVYDMNKGFDPGGKTGVITVGAVKGAAAQKARGAKGERITVDGQIIRSRAQNAVGSVATEAAKEAVKAVVASSGARPLDAPAGGLLLAAVNAGEAIVPEWRPVTIGDLTIEVTADALMAPVTMQATWKEGAEANAEYGAFIALDGVERGATFTTPLRLPVSYEETIQIARKLGAVALTKEWWDAAWSAADVKIEPVILGASSRMGSLGYSLARTRFVNAQGARPGVIVRDAGKGWILSPRLDVTGAVNYGMIATKPIKVGDIVKQPGEAIQSPGAKHDPTHYDNSQVCYLVRREVRRGSEKLDALDVLEKAGIARRWLDVYR